MFGRRSHSTSRPFAQSIGHLHTTATNHHRTRGAIRYAPSTRSSQMAANETANGPNSIAVTATATGAGSIGVHAKGEAVGIRGDGKTWHGVVGFSEGGFGVYGEGLTGGSGVVGKSKGWHAVG